MRKVAKLSKQPEKPLILPYEEVNTNTLDKSLSGTSVQHGAQSKATADKKSKKKRNPPSSKPKTSKIVRESSSSTQVADTQHTEEPVTTADATKGLDVSELAEEQENQPKTTDAKKAQENIVDEDEHFVKEKEVDDELTDSRIRLLGNVTFEELHGNAEESPYTKSEIKIVKIFNLQHSDDDDQIKFMRPVYSNIEDDTEAQSDGIKITLTNSSMDARHKEELSKSEEMATNNVLDELADMANSENAKINSSIEKPSLLDPLGHLHIYFSSLTSRVEHLESSLAQQVANKIEDSMPKLVANAFEERIHDLLSDTLKNILP
ncbi:hypothetical protein Tco_1136743 [Tanacetum coccineum]